MRITLIKPSMKRGPAGKKMKRALEPLSLAVLAGLTPSDVEIRCYDDRVEDIPCDQKTDLAGITVETLNAARSYEIAAEYRKRNVPVILGGFHPSLIPEEAARHADALVIGEAEPAWKEVVEDLKKGKLKEVYRGDHSYIAPPRRTIFEGKPYLPVRLLETSRGCGYRCEFCAVHKFFDGYHEKPIAEVVEEVRAGGARRFLFTDDSFVFDRQRTERLLTAIAPLGVEWFGQVDLSFAEDEDMIKLFKKSGCRGLLVGVESLREENLSAMGKPHRPLKRKMKEHLKKILAHRIPIYVSFIFGYDHDDALLLRDTVDYALSEGFFLANFCPLLPFPGTRLYTRLGAERRLTKEDWWLDEEYEYGDVVFEPRGLGREELQRIALDARKRFYGAGGILKRMAGKTALGSIGNLLLFLSANLFARKELRAKSGGK